MVTEAAKRKIREYALVFGIFSLPLTAWAGQTAFTEMATLRSAGHIKKEARIENATRIYRLEENKTVLYPGDILMPGRIEDLRRETEVKYPNLEETLTDIYRKGSLHPWEERWIADYADVRREFKPTYNAAVCATYASVLLAGIGAGHLTFSDEKKI